LIWMDSLCIPQEKRLRKLSITGMNKVYTRALATLVMDPGLMHASPASGRQLLLWVSTSAKIQRMWTLSEGRLSRSPYFVVRGGVTPMSHLWNSNDLHPVSGVLTNEMKGLFLHNLKMFRYVHQSLDSRTTSKRQDEAPTLAALFAIDPRPMLETTSLDERMALFWIAHRHKVSILMKIPFLGVEKLPIPGLR
jgi:hypothetical protein